jgi:hypothetical protein
MTPRMPDPGEALAVCRTLYDFAAGIDTRDWGLYRSAFADEFDLDYTSYRAGSAGRMRADDWVERAKVLFTGLDASQHCLSNPRVTMHGADQAELMMYVQAEHFLTNPDGDNWFTLGGYYADTLTRVDEVWKITGKTLVVTWNRGNRQVLALAAERGRARLSGAAAGGAAS